jgi:SAM-dependent methyltransferase
MTGLYVQFGCGLSAPDGWLNFDSSPTLRAQRLPLLGRAVARATTIRFPESVRYGDIVKGLPVAEQSCRGVYASHVLEHLALDDLRAALRNTFRILEPGGVFRLVVPDLELMAKEYVSSTDPAAAIKFMQDSLLGETRRPRGSRAAFRLWLGNSDHRWMWDYKALRAQLEAAGFRSTRRAQFGDSSDRRFTEAEDPGRWQGALGIETYR